MVEFLDNTVIHRPTSQQSKFADITSPRRESRKLPHYKPLPSINPSSSQTQNVLNLDEERKQEEEPGLGDILEKDEKFSLWTGKFEKTHDAVTLVKGYFQQWIPTPDNFRSLLTVSEALDLL